MAYKSNSNKFWTGFLAVLLVLVIAGTAALVGVLSDGEPLENIDCTDCASYAAKGDDNENL